MFQPFEKSDSKTLYLIIGISTGILLLNIIFQVLLKNINPFPNNILKKIYNLIYTCTISILMLTFFIWQDLPVLNLKLGWALVFVIALIWIFRIASYMVFGYKKEKIKHFQEETFNKYIRNNKK